MDSVVSRVIGRLSNIGVVKYYLEREYLEWSEELFQIYEIDPADFTHRWEDWSKRVHPEDLPQIEALFQLFVKGEADFDCEFRIALPNESIKYIKAKAEIIEDAKSGEQVLIATNQDITDLVQSKKQQDELLLILKESQETAQIGSWQYDVRTGITINDAATKKICGLAPDYDLQANEGISFYKEGYSRDKITELFNRLIQFGEPYDVELEMVTKQGKEIWVRTIGKPEFNANNEVVRVFGVFQEISKQKRKELELLKKNQTLEMLTGRLSVQNQKLGDFAQITAHNLRAPVANLLMLKDLYLNERDSQELSTLLEMTAKSTIDLSETLDHLMDALVVKYEETEEKLVFLEQCFRKVQERLGHLIQQNAAEIYLDFQGLAMRANPLYLESIFLNLLSNALKYRKQTGNPKVEVSAYQSDDQLFIEFSDNGIGIDLTLHRERIFGLHKTFHKHPEARGVGLFMVKTQVEAMGGSIAVKSVVNQGTTFIISFSAERIQNL